MKEKYIVEDNNGEVIYKPRKKYIAIGIALGDPKICSQCNLDPLRGLNVFATNEDFTQKLYEINPSKPLDFFSLKIHKKIKMIECVICKQYQDESEFIELRYGGFAICRNCSKTPEVEEYKKKQRALIEKANLKTQEEMDLEFHERVGKYDKW